MAYTSFYQSNWCTLSFLYLQSIITRNMNNMFDLWHLHLGYPATNTLKQILSSCNVSCHNHKHTIFYACQHAKSHKLPFSLSKTKASYPLSLVHTDLWGLAPILSTTDAKYSYSSLMTSLDFHGYVIYILKIKHFPPSLN